MIPKTLPAFSVLAELGKNYRYVSGRSAYFCLRTRTPSAARGQAVRRATSAKCGVLLHKSVCRVKSIRVFWDNVLKVSKVLKVVKVFNVDNVFFPKIADACNRRYRRLRGIRSPRLITKPYSTTRVLWGFREFVFKVVKVLKVFKDPKVFNVIRQKRKRAQIRISHRRYRDT